MATKLKALLSLPPRTHLKEGAGGISILNLFHGQNQAAFAPSADTPERHVRLAVGANTVLVILYRNSSSIAQAEAAWKHR